MLKAIDGLEVRNISKKYFGIEIGKCKLLGQGYEGKVYLTPRNEALKLFKDKRKCRDEYNLLKCVEGSVYFPRVINVNERCILREYVPGTQLDYYIKEEGLSKRLCINLIKLIDEFKRLNFTRLDMAARHIYVQQNESIKVIDPRKCYTKQLPFPQLLLNDLDKSGYLDEFIKVLIEVRPDLAESWVSALNKG